MLNFLVIILCLIFNLVFAFEFNTKTEDEKSYLGVEVKAKLKLGITPDMLEDITKFDELQGPSCSVSIKPFVNFTEKDKLGFNFTVFKYKPEGKEAYFFFQAHGFDLRLLCADSALAGASIGPISSYFVAPPKLAFAGKSYKDNVFSYPKVAGGSMLLCDNFGLAKYLAPKLYIATPAICDVFSIAFSYSPFSMLDRTIRSDYDAYSKDIKNRESKVNEIKKLDSTKEAIKKLPSDKPKDDYSLNVVNAFSIAPKLSFKISEDVNLTVVGGVEIATEELHLFRGAASFVNKQVKTNTLVTPYLGSEIKICNFSLSAQSYFLYEPDLKENKDLSYVFSAASKVSLGKLSFSVGGLFGKQMCHYLDPETYKPLEKSKRTYNFNNKLLLGVQYSPINEVTFYLEGGIANVRGYNNSGSLRTADSEESSAGIALGVQIKV